MDMNTNTASAKPTTVTLYRITASCERLGSVLDCSQAEVLGDSYGVTYTTQDAAQTAADELQGSIADYDLDPSTRYSLSEYPVQVYGIETSTEDGAVEVSAQVLCAGYQGSTVWTAKPRHTTAGVDGIEPAGASIDDWADRDIVRAIGADAACALGLEILALAGRS